MTEKELLKLRRSELLEIMLAQSQEIDNLRQQLDEANAKLADREIRLSESGSIAEASLRLTNIFEEAQKAVDLYVDNMKRLAAQGGTGNGGR
jgi:multidrug resistance efflux pump